MRGRLAHIVEVGPRDGLQNEKVMVSVEDRVEFIRLLAAAGCQKIEAGSFVSEKYVPSMANTEQVMRQLDPLRDELGPALQLSCLVPTKQYVEKAIDTFVDEIAIFASASEGFSMKVRWFIRISSSALKP